MLACTLVAACGGGSSTPAADALQGAAEGPSGDAPSLLSYSVPTVHEADWHTPIRTGGVVVSGPDGDGFVERRTVSGLAFDSAGNLYFGVITYEPVRIELMRRAPDGAVASLGTIVDTSAGWVGNGVEIDIAVGPGDILAYNTPRVFTDDDTELAPASIVRLDLDTGQSRVVATVDRLTSGLAFDSRGNLYFGDVAFDPVRIELRRLAPNGSVQSLGTIVDTSAGWVGQGVEIDIAVGPGDILAYNTPRIFAEDTIAPTSIVFLDLNTGSFSVAAELDHDTSGLAFDGDGALYFGKLTWDFYRGFMMRLDPDGTVTPLFLVAECGDGGWVSDGTEFDIATNRGR